MRTARERVKNEMTERLPFRPLCLRTVASKGFCTPAELQPTSAGARCKGEATALPWPAQVPASPQKPLAAGKALPGHSGATWSGVRAAEGARLEIVWAGLTRLEGSNPSHSVARRANRERAPARAASPLAFREHSRAYSSAGERPLHTREVLGSIPSTPISPRRRARSATALRQRRRGMQRRRGARSPGAAVPAPARP